MCGMVSSSSVNSGLVPRLTIGNSGTPIPRSRAACRWHRQRRTGAPASSGCRRCASPGLSRIPRCGRRPSSGCLGCGGSCTVDRQRPTLSWLAPSGNGFVRLLSVLGCSVTRITPMLLSPIIFTELSLRIRTEPSRPPCSIMWINLL